MQMIRAASRGAMIRAHGQRKDFGVEYSSTKRIQVGAGELVAWEFRERSAGGPHTVDFKLEFVEPGMQPGVSALSSTLSPNALSLSLRFCFCFCSAPGYARCPRVPSLEITALQSPICQAGSVSFLTRRVCVCALPDKTINAQEEIEILETDRLAKHAGSIVTEAEVRKRFCPTTFHIKTILLPRQARDRHKEQTTHSK